MIDDQRDAPEVCDEDAADRSQPGCADHGVVSVALADRGEHRPEGRPTEDDLDTPGFEVIGDPVMADLMVAGLSGVN